MKTLLHFDQEGHDSFIKKLETFTDIFPKVIEELKKQGVEVSSKLTFQSLREGNFLEIFHKFHKGHMLKNDVTKKMLYPRYLDLYGYNTSLLESLEEKYMSFLKRDYQFYSFNHEFYRHCEIYRHNSQALREIYEKAPKKKSYVIYDFVKVKGNQVTIDVPKELFALFATNKKQEEISEKVNQFLDIAQELDLEYEGINSVLKNYLVDSSTDWGIPSKKGLSQDFRIINFDYNKILQIK